jgi:hypothetical protein
MSKRVYVVTNTTNDEVSLVRAANTVQARNAVAKSVYTASLASQEDLIAYISAGKTVVNAVEEAAE